jgi:hypothetical protein
MPYDLYGQYYPSRRDAENAEMAQCAAIDADLATRRIESLERKLHEQSQPTEPEYEINELWKYIRALEERITNLESKTKGHE